MDAADIIRLATEMDGIDQGVEFGHTLMWDRNDEVQLALALLRGETLYECDYTGILAGELVISDDGGAEEKLLGASEIRIPNDILDAVISGLFGWQIDTLSTERARAIWREAHG